MKTGNRFASLSINEELIKTLSSLNFDRMSPVQEEAIPHLLKNESLLVKASTGTGKTLAYLVANLNDLNKDNNPSALIVLPTRVLASQVVSVIKQFKDKGYKVSYSLFLNKLDKANGQIIVTTSALVGELITKCNLKYIKRVIFDEGDMLLLDGFESDVINIIGFFKNAKISIFTASVDENMNSIVKKYIGASKLIDVTEKNVTASSVKHHLVNVHGFDINRALITFIKLRKPYKAIIFASKKSEVLELDKALTNSGISHATVYGGQDKSRQKYELRRFIKDEVTLLLSSDIMSRGIDIEGITDVISINIPFEQVYYFHRAGRVGRFYTNGDSYLFYDSDDVTRVKDLMKKVDFDFYTLKKDELKQDRNLKTIDKKVRTNVYLEESIRREVKKVRTNKVKPNYKKKIKKAVEKAKRMHKIKIIRENIAKKDQVFDDTKKKK